MRVRLSNLAKGDVAQAHAWYDMQQPGLGKRFLKEVDEALRQLASFHAHAIRYDNVRIKQVNTFPYLIHYVVLPDKGAIEVDTIQHAKRDGPLNR